MRCSKSAIAWVALLFLCIHIADSDQTVSQDGYANSTPTIVYPAAGVSLSNVNIHVLVVGHSSWHGKPLLVVLDHGVQGLVVPESGQVDLGIVAAGRQVKHFAFLFFVE